MTEQQAGFRNPTVLTSWTIRLLYAQVAVSLVAVFSGWLEYELLGDLARGAFESDELADAAAEASDARQLLVGIFQIAIFIVGGILMLMWIHRANYNARQLGAAGLRFTPGWAVGWYFIPILNLWKPYQAMKEIWKASAQPSDWNGQSVPSLLPWWWLLWIVSSVLDNLSFRLSMNAATLDELVYANIVTQVSDALTVPLCLVFLAIVRGVHGMQMAQAKTGG